eukprot:7682313-Prorocentrum_lima.AAC.1
MTSSLVGSEMCIRDSPNVNAGSQPTRWSIHHLCAWPTQRSLSTDSHHPVSYTHLTLPTICSV